MRVERARARLVKGELRYQAMSQLGLVWIRILNGFGQKNGGMILLRFWAAAIQGPGANPFPPLFPCDAVLLLVGNKLCDAARKGIHIATP